MASRTKYLKESETDQIFAPISTTENGGRGTHFAKFLISQILKKLNA